MAVVVFVIAMICLFAAACYYLSEVNVALSSVRNEARDERFMDIADSAETHGSHHV
jgi:hypothetical protein